VCFTESWFVQVTVIPAFIVVELGLKAKLEIFIVFVCSTCVPVFPGEGAFWSEPAGLLFVVVPVFGVVFELGFCIV